ncbi:MAG: aminotransferase class I/II-fold pyridoxal phosphate-dependent enzyme [Gemmatimonadetes bacterium]|nr:aminotransferase class I/II-fold pyridoxal phosphate-dependent enzyme [Gemmatimonadota bacterium]
MSLLDRLRTLGQDREDLLHGESDPFGVPVEEVYSATEARIGGRTVLLAGTNNYLGLTFDPGCIQAAHDALAAGGTGTTGSRMANGSYASHLELERELADFYGCRFAIIFSAGYLANLGMISALVGPGDVAMIDADCHASIYDGCRLSGADTLRFRHNDPESLDKRLGRLGEQAARTLIIVEGLYSMLGDRAPLQAIVELKRRYGCLLMVDEAHSLGVLGENGRGLAEETGTAADVDFVVGTFSKSLGGVGGFSVSDRPELELVRYSSRPYIFTASPAPSVVASTREALSILRSRPELRERLWHNARQLYGKLEELGYRLGPDVSPVVAARLDTPEKALALWRGLIDEGVYVNLMLPPATPAGQSLVRCSVSAAHTPEQLDRICEAFATLSEQAAHLTRRAGS